LHLLPQASKLLSVNYPVKTAAQLRAVLRALRRSHKLSQTDLGQLLGVNQKRVARIEHAPGVTSFDQIAQLVAALGGQLGIEIPDTPPPAAAVPAKKRLERKASPSRGDW
jgi:HTH-type transcriptional regulator / antitoxin HipB